MEIERVGSYEELKALEAEWRDLYARDGQATPFQRPEWLLPWWRIFGSGELFSFTAREKGQLMALAPLFLHWWNNRRQVTFLGNGVSDHLGFVLDGAHGREAVSGILEAIGRERDRWDLCDLQDLPHESILCGDTDTAGLSKAIRPQYTCSEIALPASAEKFHASLPRGIRRNLRRYRERLDECGQISFETWSDARGVTECFSALIDLHRARWRSKDDAGMIDSTALEQFHSRAALNLAVCGVARLHALRLDDRIVAAVYTLLERGRAYSYLGGFDPTLARFSPGALALDYAIQQSIDEGALVFDFLRGEEEYKKDWGATAETTYRLLLWHEKVPLDLLEAA